MLPSELFYRTTQRRFLYNIMPIDNVRSVLQHGLLSYHNVDGIAHTSIAMNEVQTRREQKYVPGGLSLHDYANLYFHYWNPMLYKRKAENENICILRFSCEVLDLDGCVVSDRNAASPMARFYSPENGIPRLPYDKIYAEFWTHQDCYEYEDHKKIKCAEVLVPYRIPEAYVDSACVVCERSKQRLRNIGFKKPIYVEQGVFF